jgi:hypothetical protein
MADESRKSPMFGVPVTVHSAKCTKAQPLLVSYPFKTTARAVGLVRFVPFTRSQN